MADLKIDLMNKLHNDKYYAEIELVRLAQDPAMNYQNKINEMQYQLERIALLNSELLLVEQQYFKVPDQSATQVPGQPMTTYVHPGQTHGE